MRVLSAFRFLGASTVPFLATILLTSNAAYANAYEEGSGRNPNDWECSYGFGYYDSIGDWIPQYGFGCRYTDERANKTGATIPLAEAAMEPGERGYYTNTRISCGTADPGKRPNYYAADEYDTQLDLLVGQEIDIVGEHLVRVHCDWDR